MDKHEFEARVIIFRNRLQAALTGPISESRTGGPFANQVVRFSFPDLNVSAILDRGTFMAVLDVTERANEPFAFKYLYEMLFPASTPDIMTLDENEIRSVTGWVVAVSRSPSYKCFRTAYLAFENCKNRELLKTH